LYFPFLFLLKGKYIMLFNHVVNQCVREVLLPWIGNEVNIFHLTKIEVDERMNNPRILKIVISRKDTVGTVFFSGVIDSYGNVHREVYGTLRSVSREAIAEINRLCCGVIRDRNACANKDEDIEVDNWTPVDDECLIRGCTEEEYEW